MRILIAFTSLSGNTRDVARLVRERCRARGHAVSWIETGIDELSAAGPDPRHDLYLFGAWSDNGGRTPAEMKRFIAQLVQAVGKPRQVAVFGTGETQWGQEFTAAPCVIAAFFDSPHPRLEIEQRHGRRDSGGSRNGPTTSSTPSGALPMQTLHAASPDDWRTAIAAHPRLLVDY